MKIGKCSKCGEIRPIGAHHIKGYLGENLNITLPYCYSCDRLAHIKARKEGGCKLNPIIIKDLSNKSSRKRYKEINRKVKSLSSYSVDKNIRILTRVEILLTSGTISINALFTSSHGRKLIFIEV
jgi:hypothetical protein